MAQRYFRHTKPSLDHLPHVRNVAVATPAYWARVRDAAAEPDDR